MKRNAIAIGLLVAACTGAFAQSKINGPGLMMLDQYRTVASAAKARGEARTQAPRVSVLVTLNPGFTAADLKAAGMEVTSEVADMAIVAVALDTVEELASLKAVKAVDFGTLATPYLDKGRAASNVDEIHTGTADGLSGHAYTGKSVAVGLYDTGLDPNHAAFRKADGTSRVKAIYVRRYNNTESQEITDPELISTFTTESPEDTHGTHVLGIIAGSQGVTGDFRADGSKDVQNGAMPYYGVAPDADLIVGCGDFVDNCILTGIEKVVNKGVEMGKPTVVNLSLGMNSGSHDPQSSTAKFLDALGKKAIVCIAAGNDGENNMAVKQRFSKLVPTLRTFMTGDESASKPISFTAEFWSTTADVLDFDIVLFDKNTGAVADSKKVTNTNGGVQSWTPAQSSKMAAQYGDKTNIRVLSGVDAATGHYYVYIQGYAAPKGVPTSIFGVNMSGAAGTTVNGYINTLRDSPQQVSFSSQDIKGYTNGSPNGSINGFGCGFNFVSVGAYITRGGAPLLSGSNYTVGGTVGDIASFSSYGTTADGRKLPHVCAPGAQIVSAVSSYWMKSNGLTRDNTVAHSPMFTRDSYYYPMQGTSMATPLFAGIVALWLDANPNLTIEDVHAIIEKTSVKDRFVNSTAGQNSLRWQAGKVNALEGIKEALRMNASVGNVIADDLSANLVVQPLGGRNYEVACVNADRVAVEVFNLQGAKVAAVAAEGDTAILDASSLADGIYVVTVTTPNGSVSRKFAVK